MYVMNTHSPQLPRFIRWQGDTSTAHADGGMNHTLSVGDQCTFFGCFKYCVRINASLCERVHGNLSEQNITIRKFNDIGVHVCRWPK